MQFTKPIPFQEALDKIGRRSPIGSVLSSSEWSDVPIALRERAFFSSRIESVRFLQRARDNLTDFLQSARETLPTGQTVIKTGSRSDFVKQMQDFLNGEGVTRKSGGLTDVTSERRLGIIFDTQTRQAQDYGYWKQGVDPDVLDEFPAQRFIRILPVKEPRDLHQQYEGEVRLKSDVAFWTRINEDFGVPWGPWGWGCGHDVEDVDREEAEQLGLLAPGQDAGDAEKTFNDRLESSVRNLDEDMQKLLRDAFGDKIEISGGVARWKDIDAPIPQLPNRPEPTEEPRKNPVSQSIRFGSTLTAQGRTAAETALKAIDKAHDDGRLTKIEVNHRVASGSQGTYYTRGTSIGVTRNAIQPEMTLTHEVGHWLDEMAMPGPGFSSKTHPDLKEWRDAVAKSKAVKSIKAITDPYIPRQHIEYLLSPQELWARSYAQWVAKRTKDKVMTGQLRKLIKGQTPYLKESQWETRDFRPIANAIDNLFKKLGWI